MNNTAQRAFKWIFIVSAVLIYILLRWIIKHSLFPGNLVVVKMATWLIAFLIAWGMVTAIYELLGIRLRVSNVIHSGADGGEVSKNSGLPSLEIWSEVRSLGMTIFSTAVTTSLGVFILWSAASADDILGGIIFLTFLASASALWWRDLYEPLVKADANAIGGYQHFFFWKSVNWKDVASCEVVRDYRWDEHVRIVLRDAAQKNILHLNLYLVSKQQINDLVELISQKLAADGSVRS